jgi:hypothetical protein
MASQSNCGMSVAIACVLLIILQSQFKNETGIFCFVVVYLFEIFCFVVIYLFENDKK